MGKAECCQAAVLDFMASPAAYGSVPAGVDRIETHASIVFLAGPFAYKVKRAVKYPFLDFSTLEKRHQACLNELRINRRTAPELYLDLVPITRGVRWDFSRLAARERWSNGRCACADSIRLVSMSAWQSEGRLGISAMRPLAEVIAAFHASADRCLTQEQAVLPLEGVLSDNESVLAANSDLFPALEARALTKASREALAALSPLLEARARGGYVRHCHGDLHLRNIVEIEGKPVLFDAIEFDDSLATIDVLYDLAFLLMDLGKRGLAAHANAVLNAYLDEEGSTGNLLGLAALPLFLSMRAMIRAKVEILRASKADRREIKGEARSEARAYFALARAFLAPAERRASSPSADCRAAASQRWRRRSPLMSARFQERFMCGAMSSGSACSASGRRRGFPDRAYAAEISDEVYAICRKRARLALKAGRTVIVDAVHAKPEERAAIEVSRRRSGRSVHRALARSSARGDAGEGGEAAR